MELLRAGDGLATLSSLIAADADIDVFPQQFGALGTLRFGQEACAGRSCRSRWPRRERPGGATRSESSHPEREREQERQQAENRPHHRPDRRLFLLRRPDRAATSRIDSRPSQGQSRKRAQRATNSSQSGTMSSGSLCMEVRRSHWFTFARGDGAARAAVRGFCTSVTAAALPSCEHLLGASWSRTGA